MKENVFCKVIPDEAGMLALGKKLADACGNSLVLFLHGSLGAGKTTLARGFLRGLGYAGKVKSPTYTLVEPYELARGPVYHFDFYRLRDPRELEFMGIQDYFLPQSICLIEWPEYGEGVLPDADLSCDIAVQNDERQVKITAHTLVGASLLERMQHEK